MKTHASNLSHLVEPRQDPLLKSVRSSLLQALKEIFPSDEVSDMASKLASDGVRTFRMDYPMLIAPKGLSDQVVQNVLRRLELLYPQLRRQAQHRNGATPVLLGGGA